jgi:integrase
MLTDLKIKNLKPHDRAYKAADRDGLYVTITPAGVASFRYDYRVNGRRETLTIGRYDESRGRDLTRQLDELEYGSGLSLAEARLLLTRARRSVEQGESPAKAKAQKKNRLSATLTFAGWAEKFFEEANLADSTKAMRRAIYERDLEKTFGRMKLEEITPSLLLGLCEKIKKDRDAPATAIHVREIVQQVYRFVQARGVKIENPAEHVRASAIATFKPRERSLSPDEIKLFFKALDGVGTLPQIKLGLKLILLTLVRKGELLNAQWPWVLFDAATMTVPAEFMKARRPHVVYLSRQALDILVALQTFAGSSPYLLPGRYETDQPMSDATLNRVISAGLERLRSEGHKIDDFSVHDLRRTGSTLLHEAGFNSDWIEKCLAHEQRGVRAVYNKAEYADQRRQMLQAWADMVDGWIKGVKVVPFRQERELAAA